jgi:hypothetical protein
MKNFLDSAQITTLVDSLQNRLQPLEEQVRTLKNAQEHSGMWDTLASVATTISLLLSGYIFWRTTKDQRLDIKRQRTLALHEKWMGLKERDVAWPYLLDRIKGATVASPTYVGEDRRGERGADATAKESNRKQYYSLSRVLHFIADINVLLKARMLDEEMVLGLFGRTFTGYLKRHALLNFHTSAESERAGTTQDDIDSAQWHRDKVASIREEFGRLLNEQRFDEKHVFHTDVAEALPQGWSYKPVSKFIKWWNRLAQ